MMLMHDLVKRQQTLQAAGRFVYGQNWSPALPPSFQSVSVGTDPVHGGQQWWIKTNDGEKYVVNEHDLMNWRLP
jgi:hypothetical protein